MQTKKQETKRCPFCAELIQPAAVKCRFCGEFLYGDRRNTLARNTAPSPAADAGSAEPADEALFRARPSLWAMTGFAVKAVIVLAFALVFMFIPTTQMLLKITGSALSEAEAAAAAHYVHLFSFAFAAVVVLLVLVKIAALKSICYEVSSDRIEWSRGIFERKIDNLDMFRVIDIRLHRSILDCIVGVGSITLVTKDPTDPQFDFEKVRNPRALYDIIKKSSLDADRRQGVIHIE